MWCELLKLETVKQNMSVYVSNLLLWYWHLSSVQSFVPWLNFHNLCQHVCVAYACSVWWLKHHEQQGRDNSRWERLSSQAAVKILSTSSSSCRQIPMKSNHLFFLHVFISSHPPLQPPSHPLVSPFYPNYHLIVPLRSTFLSLVPLQMLLQWSHFHKATTFTGRRELNR